MFSLDDITHLFLHILCVFKYLKTNENTIQSVLDIQNWNILNSRNFYWGNSLKQLKLMSLITQLIVLWCFILICSAGEYANYWIQTQNLTWTFAANESKTCGVIDDDILVTRVTGGRNTSPGEFPWMAAIYITKNMRIFHLLCGGTLITSKHVLSAGKLCLKIS